MLGLFRLFQCLQNLFSLNTSLRHISQRRRRASATVAANVQSLECRCLLTSSIQLMANGNLVITGPNANDVAEVSNGANNTIRVFVQVGGTTNEQLFPRGKVSRIIYNGNAGDDTFVNLTNVPSVARGGAGADSLTGGTANDELHGEQGDDRLWGGDGDDRLVGGSQNDVLCGGVGNDVLLGGTGTDQLFGEAGNDTLDGGGGNDRLSGAAGNDSLIGGWGDDVLEGGSEDDFLDGGSGADRLLGHAGHDRLLGGNGADELLGGGGNDVLVGGNGMDHLVGEAGNDTLEGNSGNDTLIGGDGADRLIGGMGHDVLSGGADNDVLIGGDGNDDLRGGAGMDSLYGGMGTNRLDGGGGGDTLYSECAADVLVNGQRAPARAQLHVKDFGAVGNGIADDTAAVQRAINAAQGGLPLYLDAGTYRLTDSILIGSNTTIRGAGTASVLAFDWHDQSDGPSFHLGNRNRKNEDAGDVGIRLENFVVQGGTNGAPYGVDNHSVTHGISFRKVRDVEVTGVEVRNVSGFGIANTGIIQGRFINNLIHDTGRDGITSFALYDERVAGFDNYVLTDLVISGNEIRNVGDDGIAVHAGTAAAVNTSHRPNNITITGNVIVGRVTDHPNGQGRGIALSGVRNATVSGNEIRRTVSTGILVQNWETLRSQQVNISDNVITDAGKSKGLNRVKFGIQVKGSDDVDLSKNTVMNAADRGVDVRDATAIDIVSNVVSGCAGANGILIAGSNEDPVRNVTVTDNTIAHAAEGALVLYQVSSATEERNELIPR